MVGWFSYIKKLVSKRLFPMSENDLCDICRIRNPENIGFTRFSKSPLDLFMIFDVLEGNIETGDIIPSV